MNLDKVAELTLNNKGLTDHNINFLCYINEGLFIESENPNKANKTTVFLNRNDSLILRDFLNNNFSVADTPILEKIKGLLATDTEHSERFNSLIAKDNTVDTDQERIALFFIISGIKDLYTKVNNLYDFKEHWIKPDYFEKVDFSSGTRKMVELAFNLYNNSSALAPLELFSTLDSDNYSLALKAINIRFNKI